MKPLRFQSLGEATSKVCQMCLEYMFENHDISDLQPLMKRKYQDDKYIYMMTARGPQTKFQKLSHTQQSWISMLGSNRSYCWATFAFKTHAVTNARLTYACYSMSLHLRLQIDHCESYLVSTKRVPGSGFWDYVLTDHMT